MVSRGWSLFLLGLVISTFLGGAIRVFFSPNRIRTWVEDVTNRKQPKFTLEFAEARLTFADGWTPGFAVEFENLKIQARDRCVTGSEIIIDRLNLPIQASAIFSQKVKFGIIGAENLRMTLQPPECDSTLDIPAAVEESAQAPILERLERFMKERWRHEIQNTIVLLDGVRVDSMQVFRQQEESPFLSIADFEGHIEPSEYQATFDFAVEPGVSLIGHQPLGKLRSHLVLSPDKLSLDGRGNLKEGQYKSSLDWDVQSGFWSADLEMQDMPATNLLGLLDQWKMLSWSELNLRNQWFRCELKSEGSLVAWRESLVRFESCGFYGELGDIHIRAGESRVFQGSLYPIEADFRSVDMAPLLNQFGELRQWVSRDGVTTGELKINEAGLIHYEGVWREAQLQIPVSRFFKIGGLSLDQVNILWRYLGDQNILELTEPTAYGQDVPFEFKATESAKDSVTLVEWEAKWQEWPKAMARITDSLRAENFQTTGKIRMGSSEPQVSVNLEASKMIMGDLTADSVETNIRFDEGKGHFKADMSALDVAEGSTLRLISKMLELTPQKSLGGGQFQLEAEFDKQGRWVVNPFEFQWAKSSSRAELVGRGFKLAVDQGVFRIFEPKKPVRTYDVFGSLSEPRFELKDQK